MRRRGDILKGKSTYTGGVPTWWPGECRRHGQRQGAKAGSLKSRWGMKTRESEYGLGCSVPVVAASHPAGSWRLRSLEVGTGRRRGRAGVRALRGESEQKEERGGHVLGGRQEEGEKPERHRRRRGILGSYKGVAQDLVTGTSEGRMRRAGPARVKGLRREKSMSQPGVGSGLLGRRARSPIPRQLGLLQQEGLGGEGRREAKSGPLSTV